MTKTNPELKFAVLATDIVLFSFESKKLRVLLIPVANTDFKGMLAVPGGLIAPEETAEEAVKRHMKAKAGMSGAHFEQLHTFSRVDRDPRGRVVSVAYFALVSPEKRGSIENKVGAEWHDVKSLPKLAYDHNEIVEKAVARLRAKLEYTTVAEGLLSSQFTLTDLQDLYESVLGAKFDKRNFRKKVLSLGILKETKEKRGERFRPAQLYKFGVEYGTIVPILN